MSRRFALSTALVTATAVVSLSAHVAAQEVATEEARRAALHRAVASDGTPVELAPLAEAASTEVSGFEGFAPELMADDLHAELRGEPETAEEVWALVQAQPSVAHVGRESVIGADTRKRTNPTTGYPARAVALITYSRNGSSYICTGNLIGADTVLTAGHCVHAGDGSGAAGWSSNVRVYPGRNGSASPYGSCTAKRLYSVTGWTETGSEQYDYGAIKLNCKVGNTVGWFGFFWQSSSLTGLPAVISGYPGDKSFGTQWRANGAVSATQALQVFYKNDTFGGMSGSGVYYDKSGCGQCIHSVHAYGLHGGAPHGSNNHATRITKAAYDNLVAWRNAK